MSDPMTITPATMCVVLDVTEDSVSEETMYIQLTTAHILLDNVVKNRYIDIYCTTQCSS